MTVQELIDFLSDCPCDVLVTMLLDGNYNPLRHDVAIKDVISIEHIDGNVGVVIIPDSGGRADDEN